MVDELGVTVEVEIVVGPVATKYYSIKSNARQRNFN